MQYLQEEIDVFTNKGLKMFSKFYYTDLLYKVLKLLKLEVDNYTIDDFVKLLVVTNSIQIDNETYHF